MKTIIIIASARKNGNTAAIASEFANFANCDTVNLFDYNILPYDYENKNHLDDFIPLLVKLIKEYELLVFATPVYWYAMSGKMKNFIDRFTDLITTHKELGKKLKGKYCAAITSSSGDHLGNQFWTPFKRTANYFNMSFMGGLHTQPKEDNSLLFKNFVSTLKINC